MTELLMNTNRTSVVALARAVCCLAPMVLGGCDQPGTGVGGTPGPSRASAAVEARAPSPSAAPEPAVPPTTLLTLGVSAYSATLAIDDEAVYVLTAQAAFRVVPGMPPEQWTVNLGHAPLLAEERIVYWADGAIRQLPKRGGASKVVVEVSHLPQRIAASPSGVAWLDQAEDGHFSLMTSEGSGSRLLYAPPGYVAAIAMHEDRVFFVERETPERWRLGSVTLAGGAPHYTAFHRGRTPAMLAVASEIFYYDGPTLTVRRLGFELDREEVVARDTICSPLAVANSVYCAQQGGLLEVSFAGTVTRRIPRGGMVTAIAVGRSRLAWLVDAGENKLALEMLPLAPETGRLP